MTRMVWRNLLIAAAILMLIGSTGFAQRPGGFPGMAGSGPGNGPAGEPPNAFQEGPGPGNPEAGEVFRRSLQGLKNYLDLTDEQVEEIQAIVQSTREAIHVIHEEMQPLQMELQELLESEAPDPTAVGNLVLEIHGLRSQIADLRTSQKEQIEALLTPEQLEKLDRLRHLGRAEALLPALRGLGLLGPGPFGPGRGH